MVGYPSLTYISVTELIAVAGDPWVVDATLRAGEPGQIAELARTFLDAGACTTETWNEFLAASQRFEKAWNRETGEFPINDSAELQQVALSLRVQQDQLPAIGLDLQNIAADLAEAQRMSDLKIDKLDGQLQYVDMLIGNALAADVDADISGYEDQAIEYTSSTRESIERYRDAYAAKLRQAEAALQLDHGYDPAAIEDVDGDGQAGSEQRGRTAQDHYDANQRSADEGLVNGPGKMTRDKADAAARLRDFAIASDPHADQEARRLAGERLDDFRMASFVGPLPTDPVTNGDGRRRAQNRLDTQRQLEQGKVALGDGSYFDVDPMTPDQATALMDIAERDGRAAVIQQAHDRLIIEGVSPNGTRDLIQSMLAPISLGATGAEAYGKNVPTNSHAWPATLSPDDAKVLTRIAVPVGAVANIYTLGMAVQDARAGGSFEDLGTTAGSVFGGVGAGTATMLTAGTFFGPGGTAVAAVGAAILFGGIGSWDGLGGYAGGAVGRQFDSP